MGSVVAARMSDKRGQDCVVSRWRGGGRQIGKREHRAVGIYATAAHGSEQTGNAGFLAEHSPRREHLRMDLEWLRCCPCGRDAAVSSHLSFLPQASPHRLAFSCTGL